MKAGKKFESLAIQVFERLSQEERYTSVEGPGVVVRSKHGNREFDLVLRSEAAGLKLMTVVECRDYQKTLDITHVDGLHSKMLDVNANKAVLVSRHGFSKAAYSKADEIGISLFVIHDSEKVSRDIVKAGLRIPVVVHLLDRVLFEGVLRFTASQDGMVYTRNPTKNENELLRKCFQEALHEGVLEYRDTPAQQIWHPPEAAMPPGIVYEDRTSVKLDECYYYVYLSGACLLFGYLDELPEAIGVADKSSQDYKIWFNPDEFRNISSDTAGFRQYYSTKDIPINKGNFINAVMLLRKDQVKLSMRCK